MRGKSSSLSRTMLDDEALTLARPEEEPHHERGDHRPRRGRRWSSFISGRGVFERGPAADPAVILLDLSCHASMASKCSSA